MILPLAASAYEYVLAVHIIAVVLAFGWTFALPILFMVGAKQDPRSLPVLHRVEYTAMRMLLNPALVVVVVAGAFLAGDGHHWSQFFVQWGLAAAVVIGGLAGAIMIPTAKRAEEAASAALEGYSGGEFAGSEEYRALVRRLNMVGAVMWAIVLLTIVFMALNL